MDFLNKAYAQLLDLFRSMTMGARIVSGLLLIVVVVSVAYLFNHQVSGPDEFLMNGESFPAAQLPAMLAAFGKANLSSFQMEGNRIRVPHSQQSAYMGALADANSLPKNFGDYLLPAVDDPNPFEPSSQKKEKMKIALEHELALIIGSMRGIESASVLYDRQTDNGLSQKEVVTATVSVTPAGNEELDEQRVQTIRQVVAGAISGLSPKNVVVADLTSGASYRGNSDGGPGIGSDDAYGFTKRMYEKDWEDKIHGALAYISGVIVKVNVELNPELKLNQSQVKVDPKPVPIDVRESSKTSNTTGAASGGRPGLAAQGGTNVGASVATSASTGPKSEDETSTTSQKNAVSSENIVTERAPLTPRRVTVTVGVLSSYYEKIWEEQHPAAPGTEAKKPTANDLATIEIDEKKKIQEFVAQLIPLPPRTAADGAPIEVTPMVSVMTFQHIASAPILPPSVAEKGLSWLGQYWSTLGTIGLGMVSLMMLRSMVRAVPATESPRSTPAVSASSNSLSQASENDDSSPVEVQEAAAKLKRRVKSGPSMRDELVEIVRDDPDAAANILRSWIGSAT